MLEEPRQILEGDAVELTIGSGLTVTVTVAVPEQPNAVVPVTLYVVVIVGFTVLGLRVEPPFQT